LDSLKNSETYHSPEIAFIIGMGRSGTTLLTNMLNSHSQIVSTPENEFVLFFKPHFQHKDFTDEKVIAQFVDLLQYKYSKTISFWKPTNELFQAIVDLPNNFKTYSEVCKLVYLHYPFLEKKENIQLIVDKNPVYSMYCKELKELYPTCKFIIITRDYRDNIVSRKKYSDKTSSIYTLAASWNYFYNVIEQSRNKNPKDYFHIKYEDLVNNPTQELQNLCAFLGLEYSESMLHFQDLSKKIKSHFKKNASENVFEKITSMHSNLEKEITTQRVHSYESDLIEKDIYLADTFCSSIGANYGYLPHKKHIENSSIIDRFNYFKAVLKIRIYYFLQPFYSKLPLSLKIRKK
jgi:hypothetical protein